MTIGSLMKVESNSECYSAILLTCINPFTALPWAMLGVNNTSYTP